MNKILAPFNSSFARATIMCYHSTALSVSRLLDCSRETNTAQTCCMSSPPDVLSRSFWLVFDIRGVTLLQVPRLPTSHMFCHWIGPYRHRCGCLFMGGLFKLHNNSEATQFIDNGLVTSTPSDRN
jgi:hypothetical protein